VLLHNLLEEQQQKIRDREKKMKQKEQTLQGELHGYIYQGMKLITAGGTLVKPGMEQFVTSFKTKYTSSGISLTIP
jgi:hypothetical protein